jgi:5-methylcytosine-specific restriction endonuclease McrA
MNEEFARAYPVTSNAELAARWLRSTVTIKKWARRLGVNKSPAYKSKIQRERMLGRKRSPVKRAKPRARAMGRTVSLESRVKALETKLRRGTLLKGPKHPSWRGGRPWQRFRDPRYVAWRKAVLERDGYTCQACRRQCSKYERGLAAHHLAPYAANVQLRYERSNGVTLCRKCHLKLHGRAPREPGDVLCACGCGTAIPSVDPYGRPRHYVNGHGSRHLVRTEAQKQRLSELRRGIALTADHRARISAGLRATKRVGRPPRRA